MRIAMIGQKGVPALHGGVERHVEELGARLAGLGHDVTVFTRPNYTDPSVDEHRGMRLVSLPTVGTKHLDAIVHSVLASGSCTRGDHDIVHYHAIGPCLATPITRLRGRRIVATIHGQDWQRAKWGRGASAVLRLAESMALRVPDATICVSESLSEGYAAEGAATVYIPNGVSIVSEDDVRVLGELGLEDGEYLLFVGRLVPEKGLHHLLDALARIGNGARLVVAGDTSGSDEYVAGLREAAGDDVVFAGYRYGGELSALFRHCALFVLPSDLEGLPIVLLEALAYGAPVLASDIPPNVEVLGAKGRYFRAGDPASLADGIRIALGDPALRERSRELQAHVVREFDWDRVAVETEALYRRVLSGRVS